jgi:hypothetical protein
MRVSIPQLALLPLLAIAAAGNAQTATTQSDSIGRAATEPLRDTRIKDDKIPAALQLAVSAPYSMHGMVNCAAIRTEIGRLSDALGPDVDIPAAHKGEGAALAAAGAQAAVNALIPGLGLVKLVTGADKAEHRVEAAVYAGAVRRGFLKGVGLARGCKEPAAPTRAAVLDIPSLPTDGDKK